MKPKQGPQIEDWEDGYEIHEAMRQAEDAYYRMYDTFLGLEAIDDEDEEAEPSTVRKEATRAQMEQNRRERSGNEQS